VNSNANPFLNKSFDNRVDPKGVRDFNSTLDEGFFSEKARRTKYLKETDGLAKPRPKTPGPYEDAALAYMAKKRPRSPPKKIQELLGINLSEKHGFPSYYMDSLFESMITKSNKKIYASFREHF
jgi:hypothetical protein